jgi:hypothetical protein
MRVAIDAVDKLISLRALLAVIVDFATVVVVVTCALLYPFFLLLMISSFFSLFLCFPHVFFFFANLSACQFKRRSGGHNAPRAQSC